MKLNNSPECTFFFVPRNVLKLNVACNLSETNSAWISVEIPGLALNQAAVCPFYLDRFCLQLHDGNTSKFFVSTSPEIPDWAGEKIMFALHKIYFSRKRERYIFLLLCRNLH